MKTWDELENTATSVHVCAGLAELHADRGEHQDALHLAGRSLQLAAGANGGVSDHVPWALCVAARAHLARGDAEAARAAAAEAVRTMGSTWEGERHRVAAELAWIASELGDTTTSARLLSVAEHMPRPSRAAFPIAGRSGPTASDPGQRPVDAGGRPPGTQRQRDHFHARGGGVLPPATRCFGLTPRGPSGSFAAPLLDLPEGPAIRTVDWAGAWGE